MYFYVSKPETGTVFYELLSANIKNLFCELWRSGKTYHESTILNIQNAKLGFKYDTKLMNSPLKVVVNIFLLHRLQHRLET